MIFARNKTSASLLFYQWRSLRGVGDHPEYQPFGVAQGQEMSLVLGEQKFFCIGSGNL